MPPMVRTQSSRKDTSINALDDLDLDDMFEGEQNGLFDELGMDLGELGDIANEDMQSNNTKATTKRKSQTPKGMDDMQFDLLGTGSIGVDDRGASFRTTHENDASSPVIKKSKRKVKRKTRDMSPFDDDEDDDDGVAMKKRRQTKKARTTVTKKTKGDVGAPTSISSPKTKKAKAASMPPATERNSSQGNLVAAAGQFGGRHKRTGYIALSKGTSKNKAKAATSTVPPPVPVMAEPPKIERVLEQYPSQPLMLKRGRLQTEISRPIESLFCGLHSSDTFYPFMATLPPEASMKKSSKQYSSLEKINASLSSTAPGPDLDDAIVKLLMLYDPVPTHDKKLLVSSSVHTTRKVVNAIDRQHLVIDLTSVSTLLKRQHDFLAQSLENMERWCKRHFSDGDYRAVYGGEKPKPILAQLTSPIVRIRIKCASIKESKLSALLIAHIPMPSAAKPILPHPSPHISSGNNKTNLLLAGSSMGPPTSSIGVTKKKRVDASTLAAAAAVVHTNGGAMAEEAVVPYSELPPNSRRERILDLLTKHALRLETQQADVDEARRKALEKQNNGLQKVVDDDDLVAVNTMTLWKWIDKSCYLSEFSEQDIRDLLTYQPQIDDDSVFWAEAFTKKTKKPAKESLCEKLQSLLVEVGTDSEDDDCEDENDDDGLDSLWESPNGTATETDGTLLDLSELTNEERAFILLRAAGLMDESRPPPESGGEEANSYNDNETDDNAGEEASSAFEDLILRMKVDLSQMDRRNNSRTAFLESSARAQLELSRLAKRQDERNSQMVAKYNQLAKKQKETKRSSRQKLPRKDADWVPW